MPTLKRHHKGDIHHRIEMVRRKEMRAVYRKRLELVRADMMKTWKDMLLNGEIDTKQANKLLIKIQHWPLVRAQQRDERDKLIPLRKEYPGARQ